ncbi:MAG: hypothetical protein ACYCVN_14995 [Acidimicrobiales bacterium]
MSARKPIVVVGAPRGGTTWTLRALGSAAGTAAILEPDNEDKYPAAIHAKRVVGRYPVLRVGDDAPAYRRLWEWIFSGAPENRRSLLARHLLGPGSDRRIHEGRLDPVTWMAATLAREPRPSSPTGAGTGGQHVIAKSIHAQFAIEWLAASFDVEVLLLLRHPASVLASWMELNLKDGRNSTLENRPEIRATYLEPWGVPLPGPDPVERMSWRIGLLLAVIESVSARHPDWALRTHEHLCDDPEGQFRLLFSELGLPWGASTEEFLADHNAPGSGFVVRRVASELSDSWRRRLDRGQLATLRRVLAWFPITSYGDSDF